MNTLQKYNPTALDATDAPASWEQVKYWADIAGKFQQASLAAQVMAGFALAELRKQHNVHAGRQAQLPHGAVIESWPELVEANAGVSDDTARRWILMADGIKSRWKKLAPQARLRKLMSVPVSEWQEADTKLVSDALYKVTDGSTQLEFMRELGLAKQPQGSGATGRLPGCDGTRKKVSLAEEVALRKEQATLDWNGIRKSFAVYKDKFLFLTDGDVEAQLADLDLLVMARKAWLKQPLNQRDTKPISAMFRA